MHTSHTIARLVGPVFCAIGIGMLTNGDGYRLVASQFLTSYAFIYFSGVLLLLAGLTILNFHPHWTPDWRSAVTALGWILTCIGAFRVIAPTFVNFLGGAIIGTSSFFMVFGAMTLIAGGFLTYKGYGA